MQKRQVLINAIMSVMQIFLIGAVLFILYKFLLNTIGVEQLGIWSLVLATTSVTQIATFGLSGSVVKFVAKYKAREDNENVSKVIQTAVISVAGFIGIVLLIGYPVIKWVLGQVIQVEFLTLALTILPYSFFALWIMIITGVLLAGLDGYQRIDLRSLLLMSGAVFHLMLCFFLAPKYGLLGLAYAKVIQNFLILLSSWFLLKKNLSFLPIIPKKWNINIFKEIVNYGINFQIISITSMFYDPMTKALLSKFGGLSIVGYYEMASRMIMQLRSLIVSANQVLVPAIAELKEKIPEKVNSVYLTSFHLLFFLSLPLFSLIIVSFPLISKIWIGHYETIFLKFGIFLNIGLLLNTLSAPAYFTYLGIGKLRWNVVSHIAIAILNAGLGFLLGVFFDGIGVVIAWVISLTLGSSVICISYHLLNKIPLRDLLPQASKKILIVCSISILVFFIIHKFNYIFNTIILNIVIVLLFLTVLFIPLWHHPIRKHLMGSIRNEFF